MPAGSRLRRAGADAAGRGGDRPGDRRTDVDPDAITGARLALRAAQIARDNAGILRGSTRLATRAPTVPTPQAPAGAPCATSRSTSWPPPIRMSASSLPWTQFDPADQHDGSARSPRRIHDHPRPRARKGARAISANAIATSRSCSTSGSPSRPPSKNPTTLARIEGAARSIRPSR